MVDKMSDFAEIEDVQIEMGDSPANPTTDNELDPIRELGNDNKPFSWNPKDWVNDAKRNYQEFAHNGYKLSEKTRVLLRAVFGEGLCTLMFLYVVMASGVNGIRANSTKDSGIVTSYGENFVMGALCTAFVSVALIYSFADVSGAHFNPAVTFATMVTGKTSLRKGLSYIGIQLLASILATALLVRSFPDIDGTFTKRTTLDLILVRIDKRVGSGVSGAAIAFVMEIILSFILVYVIFATAFDTVDTKNTVKVATNPGAQKTSDGSRAVDKSVGRNLTIYTTSGNTKAGFAPIAIGFTLGFLTFIGGSVSGGAFNPARAFGPAIVAGDWENHWVYWFGDFFGAALAGFTQKLFSHQAVQSSGNSAKH